MTEDLTDQLSRKWYVAVLYTDLCGSTRLVAELDAVDYAIVQDRLTQFYRDTITTHNGTMLQVHGDGALAMFGFPAAGEEDVRLAVNAALALHENIKALHFDGVGSLRLRLHSGVHAGVVVIQPGDIHRGSYQLQGELIHVSARLSSEASEDQILVTEQSLRGSKPMFQCGETRSMVLRGFDHAVTVTSVLGQSDVANRYQARRKRSRLPFVGRHQELSVLLENWQQVRTSNSSRVVSLVGPPGVGKTRLVDELFSHVIAQDAPVLQGFCESLHQTRALEPFLNLSVSGTLDSLNGALSEEKDELIAQLVNSEQPFVLFIDDSQWIDESSVEVLRTIIADGAPALLVMASRIDRNLFAAVDGCTTLNLDGLNATDMDVAIQVLVPHAVGGLGENIAQMCGGNPLFLEELCNAQSLDRLDHEPSAIEFVPQWLYSLVQSRVTSLAWEQMNIVQAAAVLGATVDLDDLRAVVGPVSDEDLTQLALMDLLFPSDVPQVWRFKHGLTREIVYHLIGRESRRALHAQVVHHLLSDDAMRLANLERLVAHLQGAGDRKRAAEFAQQAGENALAAQALDVARMQLTIAIESLETDLSEVTHRRVIIKKILKLARSLSRVALLDPSVSEVPLFERIRQFTEETDSLRDLAMAHYWLGTVYYGLGRPRLAIRYHKRAHALAVEAQHDRLTAETEATLAQATASNCDHDSAIAMLEQVVAGTESVQPGSASAPSVSYSLACLAMVMFDQGKFEQGVPIFERALDLVVDTRHPAEANVLAKGVVMSIWHGRMDEAIDRAGRVIDISQRIHNDYLETITRVLLAYVMWRTRGELQDLQIMKAQVDRLEEYGQGQFMSLGYGWLAEEAAKLEDDKTLRRYAARAIWRSRSGDGFGLACAFRGLAIAAGRRISEDGTGVREVEQYLMQALKSAARRTSAREELLTRMCAIDLLGERWSGFEMGQVTVRLQALGVSLAQ